MRWIEKNFKVGLQYLFEETLKANADAELILNSGLSFAGWHVAEKLNIPNVATYLWPVTPSRYLPAANGKIPPDWLPFKAVFNYLSTKFSNQLFFNLLLSQANHCREEILGLGPMRSRDYWYLDSASSDAAFIYGFSPTVIPKPADWSSNQQICGYWFLESPQNYQPHKDLMDFLAGGPAPVYIGFGSLVDHELEEMNEIILTSLENTGQRGILLGGWSQLGAGDLPDYLFQIESVPHDWLFPQMAAVIHHGGAGTTAAGLRAGVPSLVVPSFGDQFFWGWRVEKIGCGPKPIPRKKLTVGNFSKAIEETIRSESFKRNSAEIGKKIRSENGIENAVRLIETFAVQGHI
jgi:hypothetical protein